MFRDWLVYLGAGEFVSCFLDAGYDLRFIAKNGLTDEDLDCVGIPRSKMGLRRKIKSLHDLKNYFVPEEEDDDASEVEEDEEEEPNEEED